MKTLNLDTLRHLLLPVLLIAFAATTYAEASASGIKVTEITHSDRIYYHSPLHLECTAANESDTKTEVSFQVTLTGKKYSSQPIAKTQEKTFEISTGESEKVEFDEPFYWLINCIPEPGDYTLRIIDPRNGTEYYSGSIELIDNSLTIEVTEAGTLPQLVGDMKYETTKLKVSGPLNGTDIAFLREMAGCDRYDNGTPGILRSLDMKEATIVAGGDFYFHHSLLGYLGTQPRSLSQCMFCGCASLREFIMPADTEVIGQLCFTRTSLDNIDFSDCLKVIGPFAFTCTRFISIKLPESLEVLGENPFAKCEMLIRVEIGGNLRELTAPLCELCPNMTEVSISEDNTYYCDIDGVIFSKDKTTLIAYPNAKERFYEMPEGTLTVGPKAFYRIDSLKEVKCSGSLADIGPYAFYMTPLEKIEFGHNLEKIERHAFMECPSLTEINLPASMKRIDTMAFSYCSTLAKVTCLAITPPELGDQVFMRFEPMDATLTVPDESVELYKNATGWKDFFNITGTGSGVAETNGIAPYVTGVYSTDGTKLASPRKGAVNILRMSDGSVRKVMM